MHATEFTDGWASFLAADEIAGYAMDMGPASHPIRGDVPDVAHAMANFDAITYLKGQAVLRQLVATVGEDTFIEGLRAYFRDHAYGNTRLADLMAAVGAAAGRDLSVVDRGVVRPGRHRHADAQPGRRAGHRAGRRGAARAPPRHRLVPGRRRRPRAGGHDVRRHLRAAHDAGRGLPGADLHLVNDEDLTFAAVRTDERSLRTMLERAGALPDPLSRALAVTTAWDMLVKGELATDDVLGCVLGVLGTERSPGVVEPFLALALRAAELWTRPGAVPDRLERVAPPGRASWPTCPSTGCRRCARWPPRRPRRSTARCWTRPPTDDIDLAWRVLARRAALGEYDADAVAALLERDPDPDAAVRAVAVRAARPGGVGQGGGVGRAVRAPLGAGRLPDVRGGERLLAPGPARAAAAVGAPLPRRGRAAPRRRHARGDVAAAQR